MSNSYSILREWAYAFKSGVLEAFIHPFVFVFALSYYGFTGDRRPVDWIINHAR